MRNIFSRGLGLSEAAQAAGTADVATARGTLQGALQGLATPEAYFRSLLTAGRTETAQRAAPAINAATAQADAARRAEATTGTARTGGTAAINREAGTQTQATIDQIINQNLMGGREAGAEGLAKTSGMRAAIGAAQADIGVQELSNALKGLGLSEGAISDLLKEAAGTYQFNTENLENIAGGLGSAVAKLALGFGL